MRKKIAPSLFFIIAITCNEVASGEKTLNYNEDIQGIFTQANNLYEQGSFDEAIANYELLSDRGMRNANIYHNLGNAYYRTKSIGKSILSYERALKFSPRDDDTRYNLKLLRSFIDEPKEGVLYKALTYFSLNELTIFCSLVYFLVALGIIVVLFYPNPKIKWMNISLGCILLLGLFWWYSLFKINERTITGIVTSIPAEARTGPGKDYSVGFTLPEGKKVIILSEKEDWYAVAVKQIKPEKIILKGWLKKETVEKI